MIINTPIVGDIAIKPIYLLYGYDLSQLLDGLQKIKNNLVAAKRYYFVNFKQFSQFYNTNQQELFNQDLFCLNKINKIIEIYLSELNFTKVQLIELEAFLNKALLSKNLCIILFVENPPKSLPTATWFKLINQAGIVIVSKNLSRQQFRSWLITQLQLLNIEFTKPALQQFIEIYQHNLLAAQQILIKLDLLYPSNQHAQHSRCLDVAEIINYIDPKDTKNSLFDLQNYLILADAGHAGNPGNSGNSDNSGNHENLRHAEYHSNSKHPSNSSNLGNAMNSSNAENHGREIIKILISLQQQQVAPILILWSITQAIKKFLEQTTNYHKYINITKYAKLLSKATEIDLAVKYIDNKLTNLDHEQYINKYIWGLLLDLCMDL